MLVDPKVSDHVIRRGKERVRKTHKDVVSFEWHQESLPAKDLPWDNYKEDFYYIRKKWIRDKCREIKDRLLASRDIVCIVVDPSNWGSTTYHYGTHYGRTFAGYEVILIQAHDDFSETLDHEVQHCHDNISYRERGVLLDEKLGYPWDTCAVHGEGDDCPYTEYNYRQQVLMVRGHIHAAYRVRRIREEKQIGILKKIVQTLRAFVQWYRKNPQS